MRYILCSLAIGLALTARPVIAQNPQPLDPPGTAGLMGRYRLWFAAVDTNQDGMLDKEELAKAFRGPHAKPFDYVPPPKEAKDKKDDKDKTEKTAEKDKSSSEEKDKPEKDKSEKDKPARKRNYSAYPDYLFLTQLDVNSDEMISKEEFDNWARDVAVQLKTQLELQAKLLELQLRLQQNAASISANDRKKLEADLKRQNDQFARAQQQLQKAQKYFSQARPRPKTK